MTIRRSATMLIRRRDTVKGTASRPSPTAGEEPTVSGSRETTNQHGYTNGSDRRADVQEVVKMTRALGCFGRILCI